MSWLPILERESFVDQGKDEGGVRADCIKCNADVSYHGNFVYMHCCKGCGNPGVCESDCVSLRMVALSRSEWLRGRLELYRHPDNGRFWICKAKTCDGCVVPWLYLDTLLKSNGRATDQMQLESNGPASLEWLRGELEMHYDPVKGIFVDLPGREL